MIGVTTYGHAPQGYLCDVTAGRYARRVDALDPEKINTRLEAERARLVAALRRMADRLEQLPLSLVSEAVSMLAGWIETLEHWAERVWRGEDPADRTRS